MSTESIDLSSQKSMLSTKYGLMAGISMSVILFLFQVAGGDQSPFLKMLRYLPLILFLGATLTEIKRILPGEKIFIKGMTHGFKMSAIAGAVLALTNMLLTFAAPTLAYQAFGV